jgi:hypothetical protein
MAEMKPGSHQADISDSWFFGETSERAVKTTRKGVRGTKPAP